MICISYVTTVNHVTQHSVSILQVMWTLAYWERSTILEIKQMIAVNNL